MESLEDSSCIVINLDHAYAATPTRDMECMIIKTEYDSEPEHSLEIKLEEVSIKSELPEEFEASSALSFEPDLEAVEIKQENVEDPLSISDSLGATTVSVCRETFFALEKELQMAKEDVKKLTDHNCALRFENRSLKTKVKQMTVPFKYKNGLETKVVQLENEISSLQAENQTYQTQISAFQELKKYHRSVEKQVVDLKSKIFYFAGVVLPSMEETHIKETKQLEQEVDKKDKQIDYLTVKIDSLSSALLCLKEKIGVATDNLKSNYYKQLSRADDLKMKLKATAQSQSITETRFKIRESNLWKRRLEAENETKSFMNLYKELKLKFRNVHVKKDLMSKDIEKLKTLLKDTEKIVSQKNDENIQLLSQIKTLNANLKEITPCQYCGL